MLRNLRKRNHKQFFEYKIVAAVRDVQAFYFEGGKIRDFVGGSFGGWEGRVILCIFINIVKDETRTVSKIEGGKYPAPLFGRLLLREKQFSCVSILTMKMFLIISFKMGRIFISSGATLQQ